MIRTALLVLALSAGACAAPRVGVADIETLAAQAPDAVVVSARAPADLFACFQERADFLPLSRFFPAADGGRYVLSGYGAAYESVTVRPEGAGSRAEVRTGAYDARWAASFERDRGRALRACAGSDTHGG